MYLKQLFTIVLFCISCQEGFCQEWQWSTSVKGKKGATRAFLWIPPNCRNVRGVVIAQNNMEEISILENAAFRKTMSEIGFAEIWVSPPFDHVFNFKEGAGDILNAFMDSLANSSGYSELRYAPVVGMGHSAAASWPYYFAAWNPERALACVSVSGQWPYVRHPQFSPDIWTEDQNIDMVPSLETMGEYEAAKTWSAEGLRERKEHPLMPLSMLSAPDEGHFASSDRKSAFIAFYIKKAVQYRLPAKASKGSAPVLKPVDPTISGWLADKWRPGLQPTAPAAAVKKYTGNPEEAFWYFDKETVDAVEKYQSTFRAEKPQLIGIAQEGKMAIQKNTHLQIDLRFLALADGVSFKMKGAFYDTVPGGSPRLANWAHLPVGAPIGHANNNEPINISVVAGPFKKVATDVFALQLKRDVSFSASTYVSTFVANHAGDNEYKPAVQQAQLTIPAKLNQGKDQHISFPAISNQKYSHEAIQLHATTDSGLPVYYYILEGPAEVDGDKLKLTKIPPKARFPVKVTVVAWQYGLSSAPKVKTAEPSVRSFYITAN